MSHNKTIHAFAANEPGGRLEPFAYEVGELSPDQIEIDVRYCGICHSDLSMLDDEWGMSQFPLVAGHEVIGTVAPDDDSCGGSSLRMAASVSAVVRRRKAPFPVSIS